MPKLNERGDVICGGGGEHGSLNGTPYQFASEGRGCWKNDNTLHVQRTEDHCLWAWLPFEDPDGTALIRLEPPRGCTFIAGGGWQWLAYLPGLQYGSYGDKPGAGAGNVALDGTMLYQTDATGTTRGLTLIAPDGTVTALPYAYELDYRALPGGQAIWPGGAHGRPVPRPFYANAQGLNLVHAGGIDWLLYWSEGHGLILQPDGASEGYVLETRPIANDPDLIPSGNGLIGVWSTTQGERPGDLVKFIADRDGMLFVIPSNRPAVPWVSFTTDPKPPDPPIPPIPPDPPVPPKPEPPVRGDNFMMFSKTDPNKIVPYKSLKPSQFHGCVNVILPDDRVLSAKGDDRDPGTDGPWEAAQVQGNEATYTADDGFHTIVIVPIDKLPR